MDLDRRGRGKRFIRQSPECPICYAKFKDQVLGSPDGCDHIFCFECIIKWAKTSKICPVDRVSFDDIDISHKGQAIGQTIVSEKKKKRKVPERYDFTTVCEVCNSHDRAEMLLCDACNLAFHNYCLTPDSLKKTSNNWYCPDCAVVFKDKKTMILSKVEHLKLQKEMKEYGSSSSQNDFCNPDDRNSYVMGSSSSSSKSSELSSYKGERTSDSTLLKNSKPLENQLKIKFVYKHRTIISDDGELFYDMRDYETNIKPNS